MGGGMSGERRRFEEVAGPFCRFVPVSDFDNSIHISMKFNYIYTETPKVGCSTVKSILQRLELGDPEFYREEFEDIHERQFSPLIKPSQVGDIGRFIVQRNPFVFCFVRNPYSRLLSSYLDKIKKHGPQKKQVLLYLGRDVSQASEEILFEEFVEVVCSQNISEMNRHWRVQYYQTFQEGLNYDFVGKLESFPKDLFRSLKRVSRSYMKYVSAEQRHATGANELMAQYYSERTRAMVARKFEIDLDYFGYSTKI
jgi:hypothetical protein